MPCYRSHLPEAIRLHSSTSAFSVIRFHHEQIDMSNLNRHFLSANTAAEFLGELHRITM